MGAAAEAAAEVATNKRSNNGGQRVKSLSLHSARSLLLKWIDAVVKARSCVRHGTLASMDIGVSFALNV